MKRWILGILLSGIFIYLSSLLFSDSIAPWVWNAEIQQYTHPAGHIHRMRSEGWGTTHLGRFGIAAIPDVTREQKKKVLIWGDSYVEAWQVDDKEKMAQSLTRMFLKHKLEWLAVGIGQSGANMADYYFWLPKFEQIIPKVQAHVILLSQPKEDIIPDVFSHTHSRFISSPSQTDGYQIKRIPWTPRGTRMKTLLYQYHLDPVWSITKKVINKKWRFLPTRQRQLPSTVRKDDLASEHLDRLAPAFDFLTASLRRQTQLPIIIIYLPHVPRIEGERIRTDDPYKQLVRLFSSACAHNNILWYNLERDFIDLYEHTGELPRGFINSAPGKGHLNPAGHALVSGAIFRLLQKNGLLTQ